MSSPHIHCVKPVLGKSDNFGRILDIMFSISKDLLLAAQVATGIDPFDPFGFKIDASSLWAKITTYAARKTLCFLTT